MNTLSSLRAVPASAALRLALAAALTCAISGAGAAGPTARDYARVGALLPLAQFSAADASPRAVAERAALLASLLAGSDVAAAAPEPLARVQAPSSTPVEYTVQSANGQRLLVKASAREAAAVRALPTGTDAEVAARALAERAAANADPAERIRVLLDPADNDTLAVHGAVADDYSSLADVGAVQARTAFDAVVQRLQASRSTASPALALDGVTTARLMQAERAVDGPVSTRVKAYLFEVPYAVGAIPVFGAEAVVAVHRSGQLASIRMTGPLAAEAKAAPIRRALAPEALEKRARLEHPGATVVPLGLRYPWNAAGGDARSARPHEAFQVLPKGQVDGVTINGRAHYVFYSVEDGRAEPLVWPKPQPEATGDKR